MAYPILPYIEHRENSDHVFQHPNIYVGGQIIRNVEEFKYLGVILDSSLTFKKH